MIIDPFQSVAAVRQEQILQQWYLRTATSTLSTEARVWDPIRERMLWHATASGSNVYEYDGTTFSFSPVTTLPGNTLGNEGIWNEARDEWHQITDGGNRLYVWDGSSWLREINSGALSFIGIGYRPQDGKTYVMREQSGGPDMEIMRFDPSGTLDSGVLTKIADGPTGGTTSEFRILMDGTAGYTLEPGPNVWRYDFFAGWTKNFDATDLLLDLGQSNGALIYTAGSTLNTAEIRATTTGGEATIEDGSSIPAGAVSRFAYSPTHAEIWRSSGTPARVWALPIPAAYQ